MDLPKLTITAFDPQLISSVAYSLEAQIGAKAPEKTRKIYWKASRDNGRT